MVKKKKNKIVAIIVILLVILSAIATIGIIKRDYILSKLYNFKILNDDFYKKMYPIKHQELVKKYAEKYNLEESLVYAMICVESSFREDAVSPKEAKGLMQITDDTREWLDYKMPKEERMAGDIFEIETNIAYGTFFLWYLYDEFEDWDTAIAAYNAGRGAVNKWLNDERYSDDYKTLHTIPFPETDEYVKKVNNAKNMYESLYDFD